MEQGLHRETTEPRRPASPRRQKDSWRLTHPPPVAASAPKAFAITMSRQPGIDGAPGLVLLTVHAGGTAAPTRVGTVTDAGLRGRLAHFDSHRANEIAAVRRALSTESGQAIVYESWPGLAGCLQFWHGFTGSQIRPIEWICEKCGVSGSEDVGGSVGEPVALRCACGQVNRLTVPKYTIALDSVSPRGFLTGAGRAGSRKAKASAKPLKRAFPI